MKNIIMIDINTEREQQVLIGKTDGVKPPETPDEAKKMIIEDISCVCEALCHLIKMADSNGYADKSKLVEESIKHLNNLNP